MAYTKLISTAITLLLMAHTAQAQPKVSSKTYNTMLSKLLTHNVPEITIAQAKVLPNPIYLDARESREYEVSHIPQAIYVGYNSFDMQAITKLNKNDNIIVYCSVGYRSEKITQKLITAGYNQVYNLYGGIFEWSNAGNSLVNAQGNTNLIHGYSKLWGVWVHGAKKVYK